MMVYETSKLNKYLSTLAVHSNCLLHVRPSTPFEESKNPGRRMFRNVDVKCQEHCWPFRTCFQEAMTMILFDFLLIQFKSSSGLDACFDFGTSIRSASSRSSKRQELSQRFLDFEHSIGHEFYDNFDIQSDTGYRFPVRCSCDARAATLQLRLEAQVKEASLHRWDLLVAPS